jgi:hypothetical protein
MGREAELFVAAEAVLVEVIGRIRAEQWQVVLPPVLDADPPATLRAVVARHAAEDAAVPDLLAGRPRRSPPPASPPPTCPASPMPPARRRASSATGPSRTSCGGSR